MNWLRRIRGAIGMGLTWAVTWGAAGLLIGVSSILLPRLPWHHFFEIFDAPLPALAVPGFFGGVLFSVVLGIAARRRRFSELSLPRFAVWGAVGGALLSLLPAALMTVGLATPAPDLDVWRSTAVIAVPFILLGAISASASLALARKGEKPEQLGAIGDVSNVRLTEGESRELRVGEADAFPSRRRMP